MKKVRVAVVGYGNIGKCAVEAVCASADMELAGVVELAELVEGVRSKLTDVPVVSDVKDLGKIDVALLCCPSRLVPQTAEQYLMLGINTVDSYDIHSGIVDLRSKLDKVAKAHGTKAILSAGWDPGSDSVIRALFETLAPKGISYTNFGPGMSMGHSVCAKSKAGVKDALSMTIPLGTGIHRRMVYVELENGYKLEDVAAAIKTDDYFAHDETHVFQVTSIDSIKDMGHGVNMVRKGVSGNTQNQLFEFNMRINNPALTGQILVSTVRAVVKQQPGAYTLIEIPVIDMLEGEREEAIKRLV